MVFFQLFQFFGLLASIQMTLSYWLMAANNIITTQRIDPIEYPNLVSTHAHSVLGGSNFDFNMSTVRLRQSQCTSIPIPQDKSNYWFPHLYIQWNNGTFTSVNGSAVIYYLFNDQPGSATAFPDDFRMISGDSNLRTFDPSSFAQQAVTFLCLDFNGVSTRHNELPSKVCPSGIRSQINFPSCWDGKNVNPVDHRSHVAFLSGGPDSGTCNDSNFPVTLPRIFMEVYWNSNIFDSQRQLAFDTNQPFVFSNGDPTGYGYHADFFNGWDVGVLQNALDNCHCDPYGDPTCCIANHVFDFNQTSRCYISDSLLENTQGTLELLPGNNPVQVGCYEEFFDPVVPAVLAPVFVYDEIGGAATGTVIQAASTLAVAQTAQGTCIRGEVVVSRAHSLATGWLELFFVVCSISIFNCL